GSRKMCSSSLHPLERTRAGVPAGISEIDPAQGGTFRFTPSYRISSSSGGRAKRKSRWWVRGGRLSSKAGAARQRAASRPTHPSRSLDAAVWWGEDLEPVQGPDRLAGLQLHLAHHLVFLNGGRTFSLTLDSLYQPAAPIRPARGHASTRID